jgi:hypothetical protein
MSVKILTCEQNSPEWIAARLGIPTASRFVDVLAQGKGSNPSKTRRTYMMKLLGERLTGEQMYSYENDHMERGRAMEDEARQLYVFARETEVQKVGFIRSEWGTGACYAAGCSPDSLIGDKGLLEIKTKLPHLQLEALLDKQLPSEHRAQVQGQLWVAEREWCDFVSYWPKLPPLIIRVERDDAYIAQLARGVEIFCNELNTIAQAVAEAA